MKPRTKKELIKIIKQTIKEQGLECDLNFIDTSLITDMSELFYGSNFNGNISKWNVSSVKDMSFMFYNSLFNGDISNWDVSNVKDISFMFAFSKFNRDISNWNVSKVKNRMGVFGACPLEDNIPF